MKQRFKHKIPTPNKVLFILLIFCCLLSCNIEISSKKQDDIKRKYKVKLSNWVGSEYYKCDSVIWVSDTQFQLLNKESEVPFMTIIVPKDVIVRVSLNNNTEI